MREQRVGEAGSTHIARCLSGLLSNSAAAVAVEKASASGACLQSHCTALQRQHVRSCEL